MVRGKVKKFKGMENEGQREGKGKGTQGKKEDERGEKKNS